MEKRGFGLRLVVGYRVLGLGVWSLGLVCRVGLEILSLIKSGSVLGALPGSLNCRASGGYKPRSSSYCQRAIVCSSFTTQESR